MRKLLCLLIFGATLGAAQTTVTVPAVSYANSILTINGVQVNSLSLSQLNLTGGQPYADGQYLALFTGGMLTFVPYTVPSGGIVTAGKNYAVAIPQQSGWSLNWYPVPNALVAAGQTYSVSPVFTGAPPTTFNYLGETLFVNSAGAVYIRVANGTGNVFAASSAMVTIR